MSIRSPNLDDRNFDDLLREVVSYAEASSGWKPSNPSDPGTVLLELFAYLTDMLIFRLNRLPEKVYVELLRLIGVQLQPPSAAVTRLRFTLKDVQDKQVTIPENTRVGSEDNKIEFIILSDADISAGETRVEVTAIHCRWVDFHRIGEGSGKPGLSLKLPQAPVIASSPGRIDLIVGVEIKVNELTHASDIYKHSDGKIYQLWDEVESFVGVNPKDCVYLADRAKGTISFAPAFQSTAEAKTTGKQHAIAGIPQAGSQVIARYRAGGGIEGNLAPNTLIKLLDKVSHFNGEVTNPERATGGSDLETLENALIRGPVELHSLQRVVTAQDFELIASKRSGLVNRAHAYTKRARWKYAPAGMVEVLLVPQVSEDQGIPTPEVLKANENDDVLDQILQTLETRKSLGSTCSVSWCHYKSVKVCVSLRIHREENRDAVKGRITERLYKMINPLSAEEHQPGWPFGQSLNAYDIYRILSEEPGVKTVDPVVLKVNKVPNEGVSNITADPWQEKTWYSAAGDSLYRTLNDGEGWEQIKSWPGEEVTVLKAFQRENQITASVAGLVAVVTRVPNEDNSGLYLSRDCGESWQQVRKTDFPINDIAWNELNGRPSILVATEKGLFVQSLEIKKEWKPTLIDGSVLSARAVAVATNQSGNNSVVVATPPGTGVYLSMDSGRNFKPIGLTQKIVEVLKIQYRDTQRYIWAGFAAIGRDGGEACVRWQLQESGDSAEGWKPFKKNWDAGACTSIVFLEGKVFAGSRRKGLLTLDSDSDDPSWQASNVNCGLPMKTLNEFEPLNILALDPRNDDQACLLTGGTKGVFRSLDGSKTFKNCSLSEFNDRVTLPPSWLFCSGEHEVSVGFDMPND
jgi:hypothetical protein